MKNVTLRQLRVFAAVARQLSFHKAASELHLTPPAVSMQVRDLEAQVGLPLFDRTAKRVSLTTTGEYLLSYALKILATMKDAEDAVARLAGLKGGRLTIGMVSTAKYFLPRLLTQFHALHPDVQIRLTVSANREQLAVDLQRNQIDLAVMGRPPGQLATRAEPFAPHPHVLVCAPTHPLATPFKVATARLRASKHVGSKATLSSRGATSGIGSGAASKASLKSRRPETKARGADRNAGPPKPKTAHIEPLPAAALADHGFIVREPGSGTRAALEQYFATYCIAPRIEMEMPSNETIKQAVMAGMGASFLSLHTLGLELRAGLLVTPAVEGMPVIRQWYVVNNLAKVLSPAAEAFRAYVLTHGEAFLNGQFGVLPEALGSTRSAVRIRLRPP